jgi:hypothetical protein
MGDIQKRKTYYNGKFITSKLKKLLCPLLSSASCRQPGDRPRTSKPQATQDSIIRSMVLDSVMVSPQTVDTDRWLLLEESIKNELSGAVANLYNFKYEQSERRFLSLKRRYPEHPMTYFIMGLCQWWKLVQTNISTTQHDNSTYTIVGSLNVSFTAPKGFGRLKFPYP